MHLFELLMQQYRLICVKGSGETITIKHHDPHSAASFVQVRVGLLTQVDEDILNTSPKSVKQTAVGPER